MGGIAPAWEDSKMPAGDCWSWKTKMSPRSTKAAYQIDLYPRGRWSENPVHGYNKSPTRKKALRSKAATPNLIAPSRTDLGLLLTPSAKAARSNSVPSASAGSPAGRTKSVRSPVGCSRPASAMSRTSSCKSPKSRAAGGADSPSGAHSPFQKRAARRSQTEARQLDNRWWTKPICKANSIGPAEAPVKIESVKQGLRLHQKPKMKDDECVSAEMSKAVQGFSAEQAARIMMARNQDPLDVAREIDKILCPQPRRKGGGGMDMEPGASSTVHSTFRKFECGTCMLNDGLPSLFEDDTAAMSAIRAASGMRRHEITKVSQKLMTYSVDGNFNEHRFRKVMRVHQVTDELLLNRLFDVFCHNNGLERVVALPHVVEALCVFKHGSRYKQLELFFKLIDVDGDRSMSAIELFDFVAQMASRLRKRGQLVMPQGCKTVVDAVTQLFTDLDEDDSGEIEMDEFCEGVANSESMWTLFTVMNPFASFTPKPLTTPRDERVERLKQKLQDEADRQAAQAAAEAALAGTDELDAKELDAMDDQGSGGWFSKPQAKEAPKAEVTKAAETEVKNWFSKS